MRFFMNVTTYKENILMMNVKAIKDNCSSKYFLLCLIMAVACSAFTAKAEDSYSPSVNKSHPSQVYWGDTHLHSNVSFDAYSRSGKISALGLDDAYRFSNGETVALSDGTLGRLRRPLDFLVIADHAENAGVTRGLSMGDSMLLTIEVGK